MKTGKQRDIKTLVLIFAVLVGLPGFLVAQERQEGMGKKDQMQTLFGYNSKITGYGSFDSKFTRLNNKDAVMIGGHGGVIFNSYFYFGLGAYGLVTTSKFPGNLPETDLDIHMGYTGLMMAFNIMPEKIVHLSIPLFVGAGNLELEHNDVFVENTAFLLFEPGLHLELNVVQFMKIGLGGGYRFVNGTNLRNPLGDSDLSYWTGEFSIVFGKFK